jgi:hypothetical protein
MDYNWDCLGVISPVTNHLANPMAYLSTILVALPRASTRFGTKLRCPGTAQLGFTRGLSASGAAGAGLGGNSASTRHGEIPWSSRGNIPYTIGYNNIYILYIYTKYIYACYIEYIYIGNSWTLSISTIQY